ncbi:MAG TPA: carbon starvation CstA family protein [Nitrospiria bacterium]|nr:carbon starvation CstA family protein [Nitrospiria bacterium]
MRILRALFWAGVALLCAVAFAIVTGVVRPEERINALWLVVAAACFHTLAYRFYGRFLARRVMELNDQRVPPAYRLTDGKNYHPTHRWVLFGHHFAAIAGAGPLLGPVLAAQFGFLPGFLWLVIGAVLAGAVQDFIILVASMRRNGRSLPQIAWDEMGPVTGFCTMAAVLFIVIVAIAGLGVAVVNALYHNPWGVFTLTMTVPIALFMGYYLHYWRPGRVGEVSAIGVSLLLLAVVAGRWAAQTPLAGWFGLERDTIVWALAGYGFFASALPIWMLLLPRDYLSTFMKLSVVLLLGIGVILMAPAVQMPAVTSFIHGGGPIIPGTLFPFVFITIACGAISGFHSLVSSGTTPKMIQRESHAMIGYGAMLLESFVGVMALIAATLFMPGDYFAINTHLSTGTIAAMGFPAGRLRELSSLVGVELAGRPGGAVSLAAGMASIFSSLPGLNGLMTYWYQFALLFEALFILTTIDAGTRVARYLLQEAAGLAHPRFNDLNWLPGILLTSGLVVFAWGYLISTGSISTIWPMFGAANQLLGTLALCVGTTVLIKMGKARYAWVTVAPMLFVGAITLTGCYELGMLFLAKGRAVSTSGEAFSLYLNAGLVAAVAGLAAVILTDAFRQWYGYLVRKQPYASSEVVVMAGGSKDHFVPDAGGSCC